MKQAAAQWKNGAHQQAQGEMLPAGQHIYLRDHSHRGRNKLQDAWVPIPFQVVRLCSVCCCPTASINRDTPCSSLHASPSLSTLSPDTEKVELWVAVRRTSGPEASWPVSVRFLPEADPMPHTAAPITATPKASTDTGLRPDGVRKSTHGTASKHSNP